MNSCLITNSTPSINTSIESIAEATTETRGTAAAFTSDDFCKCFNLIKN